MLSSTISRQPAEQTWPLCRNAAVSALSTAVSKSASANTMFGLLPPSSSATRFTLTEAAAMIDFPPARLPVNDTRSTSGLSASACPTRLPGPSTRFTTPFGTPASSRSLTRWIVVSGVACDGLTTIVSPAASAGATFHEICRSG